MSNSFNRFCACLLLAAPTFAQAEPVTGFELQLDGSLLFLHQTGSGANEDLKDAEGFHGPGWNVELAAGYRFDYVGVYFVGGAKQVKGISRVPGADMKNPETDSNSKEDDVLMLDLGVRVNGYIPVFKNELLTLNVVPSLQIGLNRFDEDHATNVDNGDGDSERALFDSWYIRGGAGVEAMLANRLGVGISMNIGVADPGSISIFNDWHSYIDDDEGMSQFYLQPMLHASYVF